MLRGVLLTAAVFLVPAAAQAGPIGWQYSSTLTAQGGGTIFLEGTLDLSTVAVGTLAGGNGPTQVTGNQSINLGGITGSTLLTPDMAFTTPVGFVATVQITDQSSGLSGTVTFTGGTNATFTDFSEIGLDRTNFDYTVSPFFSNTSAVLTLGGHQYDVEAVVNGMNFSANVQALTTPEPATWISALVGVTVIGALRRARSAWVS